MSAYTDYLTSYEWHKQVSACLKYYGNRCALCNSTDRLEVHHRTYERLGQEDPADLICLCHDCHSKHHAKLPVWFDMLGTLPDYLFDGIPE